MSYIHIGEEELWKRPFTTKRYLHPPFSEEMATMWSQFMWMLGDIYEKNERDTPSAAVRFLHGENDEEFDFKKVIYNVSEDGVPVHSFHFDMEEWDIYAESFCSIEVSPTVYTKVRISNRSLWPIKDVLGIIVRTGREGYLHGMHDPDGYVSHNPNIRIWGNVPRTWKYSESMLTDGKYTVSFDGIDKLNCRFQGEKDGLPWYRRGILKMDISLEAGQECEFTFAFRKGESIRFDYEMEREKTVSFWLDELSKINLYPGGNGQYRTMVRTLVAQCLQMFCYHVGKYDYVLPRQGSTQRNIWVGEAYEMLMALDRIGNFYSYTEKAYDLFFDYLQETEGENSGMIKTLEGSIPWGGITGAAIKGVCYHIMIRKDVSVFDKYKEKIYAAFCWVERQRKSDRPLGCTPNIMPPMQACDWESVDQYWTKTDMSMIEGYAALAECFSRFKDERAQFIKDAYEDYKVVLRGIVNNRETTFENKEELLFGDSVGASITDPPTKIVVLADGIRLATYGIIAHQGEEMRKLETYYHNRNLIKNGLHGYMHASGTYNNPWSGYTWYTSTCDMHWFWHYMIIGDRVSAWETLKGQLKYSMTKEYYMLERYASNDPYYVPWLPNASANGRTLMMLCDYFLGISQLDMCLKKPLE